MEPIYNMDLQIHTRKRVQTHIAAKVIVEKLAAKAKNLEVFAKDLFFAQCILFATVDDKPITVDDDEFTK